jgi:nucleotide-binding universal stress UspA family protein
MNFPARRILVPIDLTPASRHAWSWARLFAGPETETESLFVYELPVATLMGDPIPVMTPAIKRNVVARMRRERPDASSWRVEQGDAVAGILRRARRADLIALGTHGRTGLAQAAFRSVAEAVMRDAPVPVLVARSAPGKARTVLAPVNLEPYAYKGLLLGAETAAHLGARLVLLHVSPPGRREGNPRLFINGLIERLPAELRAKARPSLLLRGGDPIPQILLESLRHDLVVLTAHRKSLLGDFVLGTTVERVVRHSATPVLAAPWAGK